MSEDIKVGDVATSPTEQQATTPQLPENYSEAVDMAMSADAGPEADEQEEPSRVGVDEQFISIEDTGRLVMHLYQKECLSCPWLRGEERAGHSVKIDGKSFAAEDLPCKPPTADAPGNNYCPASQFQIRTNLKSDSAAQIRVSTMQPKIEAAMKRDVESGDPQRPLKVMSQFLNLAKEESWPADSVKAIHQQLLSMMMSK